MEDADLKHLHETIAKQWHLFAETMETDPVETRADDRPATKTSTNSLVNRKAAGGRRSKRKVTSKVGNAARLRQHAIAAVAKISDVHNDASKNRA